MLEMWPRDTMTTDQKRVHDFRKRTHWPDAGACNGHPYPELWDTCKEETGRPGQDYRDQVDTGKKICLEECPVVVECREYAMELGMPWGIWGGMDPEERRVARQRMLKRRWRERAPQPLEGLERMRDDKGRWAGNTRDLD